MKKYLVLALASLFAFASCSKESIETPGAEETIEKVSALSFTSTRPQVEAESKTAWDGSKIIWSEGDKIRVGYTLDGTWMGREAPAPTAAKFYQSANVSIDSSNPNIGKFDVPVGSNSFVDPGESGEYVFYGIYPDKAIETTVSTAPNVTLTLPSVQTPAANSFDATGDVMVGKTASMTITGFPTSSIGINWTRVVAHLDLTFKNLSSVPGYTAGETVSSIKLTANTPITGTFNLNLSDNSVSNVSSNEITLSGSNLSISGGNIEAWACIIPATITSLDVEIITDKAKYTRSITGISKTFKQNARNLLAINMASASREKLSVKYVLISDTDDLTEDSEVIIVTRNTYNGYKAISTTQRNNNRGAETVNKTTVDGITYIENPSDLVQVFTLKSGNINNTIAFQCKNGAQQGNYIYAAGNQNNNYLRSQSTLDAAGSFTVSFATNTAATLLAHHPNTNKYLLYNNGDSSNLLFACYRNQNTNNTHSVQIFKKVGTGNGTNLITP